MGRKIFVDEPAYKPIAEKGYFIFSKDVVRKVEANYSCTIGYAGSLCGRKVALDHWYIDRGFHPSRKVKTRCRYLTNSRRTCPILNVWFLNFTRKNNRLNERLLNTTSSTTCKIT